MRLLRTAVFALLLAGALAFASSAGAALIGIYRNSMENEGPARPGPQALRRALRARRLRRRLPDHVGKETKECSYRTPVIGRDLEIAATERLLSSDAEVGPALGLPRRSTCGPGGGARYQLAVFPLQRKAQIRKVLADGTIEYLDIEKDVAEVGGADKANQLRLRAFNVTAGKKRATASCSPSSAGN